MVVKNGVMAAQMVVEYLARLGIALKLIAVTTVVEGFAQLQILVTRVQVVRFSK